MDKKYVDFATGEKVTLEEWNRRNNARKSGQAKTSYSFTEQPKKDYSPLQGIKAPVQNTIQPTFKPSVQPIDSPVSVNPQNTPIQTSKYRFAVEGKPGVIANNPLLKNTYADRGLDSSKPIAVNPKKYIDEVTGDRVTLDEYNKRKSDPTYYKQELKKTNSPKNWFDISNYKDRADRFNRLDNAIKKIEFNETAKKTEAYNKNLSDERRELERVIQRDDFTKFATIGMEKKENAIQRMSTDKLDTRTGIDYLNDKERRVFNYYFGKYGVKEAYNYLDKIMPELNQRMTQDKIQKDYKFGQEHEVLSFPLHAARSLMSGVGALSEVGNQVLQNKRTGKFKPIDVNSPAMLEQNKQDALAAGIVADNGPIGSFLTQVGLSMVDMAAALPFGQTGSLAILSSNAAGSAALNAAQRGATPEKALAVGIVAGAVEYATEKIGIDNLFRLAGKPTKSITRAIFSQMGAEGLEEPISQYANFIADIKIMGESSEYNLYIKELERVGFTREQAERDAKKKFLIQDPLMSLLGGVISGGVFGVAGASVGNYQAEDGIKPSVSYGIEVDAETKNFLENVAKKTGINIEVAEIVSKDGKQMSSAEGYYDRSQNKMVFAPDTSKANIIKGVAMHELTHSIEGSKFYEEYSDFAINTKYKNQQEFENEIQTKIQQYAKQNVELNPIDAQKEIVAEITRNTIFDEASINKLVAEKPNIAVQVYQSIVKAIDTAKAYLTGDTETLELEKARRLFEKALQGNKTETGTVQMSIKDDASTAGATTETIEDAKREWKEKGTDSKYFKKWFGDSKVVDEGGKSLLVDGFYLRLDNVPKNLKMSKWQTRLFEAGRELYEKYGSLSPKAAINTLAEREFNKELLNDIAYDADDRFFFAGAYGDKPKYKIAIRYGDIPENGRSTNWGTRELEKGISVVNYLNEKTQNGGTIYDAIYQMQDIKKYFIGGWDLGDFGSDGEHLLLNAEVLTDDIRNIKSVDNIGTFDENNPDIRYSVKDNEPKTKRSEFYENTIKRAKDIPQEVKDKLNPESFDFIPESSKEWQKQAEKNVNADMDGVIEKLKNAPSISGGIEGHEAAVVAQRISKMIMETTDPEEGERLKSIFVMISAKTREVGRALKATDTAWDKTDPAAAVVRAEREIQKVTDDMKKRNPKKFADAESEKKQLQTKMKNAEKLAQKDKAEKKLTDEQAKKAEDKRKKQMLERWVRDTVPRAKQKNMLEKIQEMYEAGAYNDEALSRLVSEKRDIPYLSLDEVKKVIGYMDKANKLKEGSYEQRMAFSRAEQIVESKLPVTARDKIKAFPRISILTGTGTQARNVVGNVIHGTYEAARENTVGLLVDVITSKFTGKRTLTGDIIGKSREYYKGAWVGISEWYKDIKNKVDTSPTRTRGEVKRNSRTFNSAFLNAIDSVVKKGLSVGDRPFYQGAYEARMYELAKLNEKAKNKMSIDEMVLDAQAYALDKVHQNDSTVKKVATRLRNVSTAIDNPFWQGVAEVGMTMNVPFTETPANIFDKVLENSPIGITKAAIELGKTKNGTFNQMKFVQSLSRGLTGTGLMAAGAMLFAKGLIAIVPYDEEYDKYRFLQSIGVQNYALKVGDKYYSLSWVEPIATPILIGAEILRGSDDDKNIIENIYGTTKIAIDSFFEASFVQGIKEVFSSRSIGEGISNKLLDAHSMFTPLSAFGKALTQWVDPYVRETKDNSPLRQMLKERVAETPFLSKTLPTRIDVFGNEMKTLDGENHAFNVFFNPAKVTDYVTTEVHDELIKMYDTTKDVNVFPDYISKPEVTYDGNTVELDERGLEKHKKEIGRALYDEYERLFKTDTYKSMTADEKAKAIRDAKTDIKNQANFKAIKSSGDFLSGLTQNKQLYYDKTDLKLEADYLKRWEELTPQDNKTVRDARLYDAVSDAVRAFDKSGSLSKDSMAKIKQYAENKRKREPTIMDLQLIAVYKATGEASVFNTNYQGLLEFTAEKVPRIINYPKTLLPELLAKSDSAVLEAYSKVMLSNDWLKMTSVQKFEALKKAKDKARKAFEEDLKNKYGARIDTSARKWQSLTPQEKALVK